MTDVVQQIKERLNIIDVMEPYIELVKAGRNFKARCPFHNEKTPSFNVSPDRGMYHCYGCGVGGDMFTFVEAIEGVDFKGALKILADKARVELVPVSPEKQSERDRLFAVLEAATEFYVVEFKKNPEAIAYVQKRGVSEATLASWRIGFAPGPPQGGWRATKEYLEKKGFTLPEIMKAGLAKGADQGKEPYDVFRNRVMFPLFDVGGRVVAFSGRTLETGPDIPKYVNSPETELFKKSEILYGYDRAKHGIRKLDFSLIVEGQFDVVMSHQAGYHNTIAVSGTAFTLEHVKLLERIAKRVVLALDADKAGIAAAKKAADIMLRRGLDVKVALLPEGKDPADLILQDPKEFKNIIGHSVHVIEFLLKTLCASTEDSRTRKLRAREEVIPYVTLLPNKMDQDHFESLIAETLGTTKDAVHYEVERVIEQQAKQPPVMYKAVDTASAQPSAVPVAVANQRFETVLAYLLGILPLVEPAAATKLKLFISDIVTAPVAEVEELVTVAKRAEMLFKAEAFIASQPKRVFQAEIVHSLNQLRDFALTRALKAAKQALEQAEAADSHVDVATHLDRVSALQRLRQESGYTAEDIGL